jgi:hypothetical protein
MEPSEGHEPVAGCLVGVAPAAGLARHLQAGELCQRPSGGAAEGKPFKHMDGGVFLGKAEQGQQSGDHPQDEIPQPALEQLALIVALGYEIVVMLLVEPVKPSPFGHKRLHLQATRDKAGTYAFVYFPVNDLTATLDLGRLAAPRVRTWWFDPRTGLGTLQGEIDGGGMREFRSPPYGPDWVLVLDAAGAGYGPPGLATVEA